MEQKYFLSCLLEGLNIFKPLIKNLMCDLRTDRPRNGFMLVKKTIKNSKVSQQQILAIRP